MWQRPAWLLKVVIKLEAFVDRPWAVPCMAVLAGLDLFIMVFPTEGVLISTVMLRPKRWWRIALWLTTGSAVGALCLGFIVQTFGPAALQFVFEHSMESPGWLRAESLIAQYGPWALAGIVVSPFPSQPAVALAALGKMSIGTIFFAVWAGRLPKYLAFAWLASYAPEFLEKWGWAKRATESAIPKR